MRKKQEMTSQPTPHTLKGITCTNDDPDSCAICFKQFPDGLIEIIAFAHIGSYIVAERGFAAIAANRATLRAPQGD